MMFGVYWYRESQKKALPMRIIELRGETMGTTYNIKYVGNLILQKEVDSVLKEFNKSLSTYIPDSEISVFNANEEFIFVSPYFPQVLKASKKIHALTEGAFDPTVLPLVKAWGFGSQKIAFDKEPNVDSLLSFVGMDNLVFDEKTVKKKKSGVQLDFNAIAQGQGADVIADFLDKNGVANCMVEIGGEVVCKGAKPDGTVWTIGIENPLYEEKGGEKIFAVVTLKDAALTTSGNYRKFYVKDGKKFPHTINPKTGRPVQHNLLSATVVAPSCMEADALATAFMVMGKEKSIEFLAKNPDIHLFLISEEEGKLSTWLSEGMKKIILQAE